jgi:GNAT superfamily N-acetyltransferase
MTNVVTREYIYELGNAHYHFLGLWPGYVRVDLEGATFVSNRLISAPFRNHATFVQASEEQAEVIIAAAGDFYRRLGCLPAFQLDPVTRPATFPQQLIEHGFRKQAEETWMVLEAQPANFLKPDDLLHIHILRTDSEPALIQAYIDCYNVCFRMTPTAGAGFGESFRGVLPHPAGIHYVATLAGAPVSAMSLFSAHGLACVYNVSTFPAYRGRGIAAALLQRLIYDSSLLGNHILFLQAVHHGPAQPLYERMGFRTHFVRDWYLPDAPGGIWS